MSLSYVEEPFPHIVGSFEENFYNFVKSSWDSVSFPTESNTNNRWNVPIQDNKVLFPIREVTKTAFEYYHTEFVQHYPKLAKEIHIDNIEHANQIEPDMKFEFRALYSQNPATETGFKIRNWHLDSGDKFMVGLWYFKHPEEDDDGGHLLLMNPETKDVTKIEYKENNFILFPNLPISWHAITPRYKSKYPRRFVNFLLESDNTPKKVLHNYRRTSAHYESEFRGKLINYYK